MIIAKRCLLQKDLVLTPEENNIEINCRQAKCALKSGKIHCVCVSGLALFILLSFCKIEISHVRLSTIQCYQANITLNGHILCDKFPASCVCLVVDDVEVTIGHLINELFYWDANNAWCYKIHMLYITGA